MVGYHGTIEDNACSQMERNVLFLCNSKGSEISARVPNSRIAFRFSDEELNIRELYKGKIIEIQPVKIEIGKEGENYVSLINVE